MSENTEDAQYSARHQQLQAVFDRVQAWQETAPESTVREELHKALQESGFTDLDQTSFDAIAKHIEQENGPTDVATLVDSESLLTEEMDATAVAQAAKEMRVCMLSTIDANHRIVSRPMTVIDLDDARHFWFLVPTDADMVDEVLDDRNVNLAFVGQQDWISITGRGRVERDDARKKELWGLGAKAYFSGGPEGSDVLALEVTPETAQYWEAPGRAATVLSMVSSAALGGTPDIGTSGQTPM